MPKPRKSKTRKKNLNLPCGCYYCTGNDYNEWILKKYKHTEIIKNKYF